MSATDKRGVAGAAATRCDSGRAEREMALGKGLFESVRNWRSALGIRLAPYGLSEATWRVLLHIDVLGGRAAQAVLAERIGIEAPTMVRLIDRMERDGWVRRTPAVEDRRINWIEPTQEGRKVIRKVATAASDMRRHVLRGLSLDELDVFVGLLAKIELALAAPLPAEVVAGAGKVPRRRMKAGAAASPRLPRTNSAAL